VLDVMIDDPDALIEKHERFPLAIGPFKRTG
jgi:hypothetical protein